MRGEPTEMTPESAIFLERARTCVRKIGVEVATSLAQDLLEQNVPGLHIYTLNRSASAKEIWRNLHLGSPNG